MRETRQSGSEGGGAAFIRLPLPLSPEIRTVPDVGSRQSRGNSGSAACCAESLWLSGADSLLSSPRFGWKAQPSSRTEGG